MPTDNTTAPEVRLARAVLKAFEENPGRGCDSPTDWSTYENGYGTNVGREMEAVLSRCRRIVKKAKQ